MRPALIAVVIVVLVMTVGEALLVHDPHHPPGFFAVFGVVACLALVLVAKLLGKAGLQRPAPPEPESPGA